ncbi:MAG TPA: response regulator [Polyangiaceae bacterium LLY-WYZ-14_1]|jgi:CheY-like chemotaxis protein|nr:response regulator [Polyangiaceae bacterium LLY-WYZ-14_1]
MSGGAGERKQLGKILLKQKKVSQEELRRSEGSRASAAAPASRREADVELLSALSEQYGLPGIDLEQVVVPLENLNLIPAEIARQHSILPILVKEDRIFLAMAEPNDRRVVDEIEFVSGLRVFPYVAIPDALGRVIDTAYRLLDRGEEYYVGPEVPEEYLQSIGIAEDVTPQVPRGTVPPVGSSPPPGGASVPVPPPVPIAREGFDDDLGIAQLVARQRASERPVDPDESAARPAPRPAHPKVLVVDDEEDIRRLLRRVLVERGYEVIETGKGLEALQLVRDHAPNLIVLDAMLPEVHGFDICRRIKGSKRYGHIPVIMVSAIYRGWRFAEDLKSSYGVESFLEKPFKISDVVSAVERALDGRPEPPEEDEDLSREAENLLESSMAAYQRGDVDGAIEQLKRGLAVDPLSFKLHYHLGLLFGRRDDVFEAIHQLETAADLQPRHFSALKNLAVLYQKAGFKHKAIEMWERALANAPDDETRRGIKDHLMSLL